ncbi:CNNM domain-containing protein [Lutimonas zeaxanthinifaciens]|uniref:CNNM domain-containing protein n=1 Tax=Lutimonas zeaxanthinifaciens TaxID=3060215 RepID=UPI00265CF1F4|nr:CNNM domain-containing protein [Lutimonas sp. YSD2104]WKK65953.1 CNNM domain-containing protein [Lutimonas sp. YSD2104]
MTLLIVYGALSICFSFLCSILEAVLLSVTPTYITVKINEKKGYAKTLKKLKDNIDQPLITILTINTIAHTVGAILVGVQAEKTFGSGNNAVGIVSAIMTFLILVLSEIIPKSIGANYWKSLANFSTKAIIIMMFPLKYTGILWLLEFTTKIVGKNVHSINVSREDFHAMADIAKEEGVFQESESVVIQNLIDFSNIFVKDIMTPRIVLKTAPENMKIKEFYDNNPKLKFSRIPIYKDSSDDISGYFLKDELLESIIDGKGDEELKTISREIFITKRETPIKLLFDQLIEKQEHIALVVDEYGAVSGIVSQEDILETLLGFEIVDESDSDEDLQVLARKLWQLRAKRHGIIEDEDDLKEQP